MKDSFYLQGASSLVGGIGKLDEHDRYMGQCLKFEQASAQWSRAERGFWTMGTLRHRG